MPLTKIYTVLKIVTSQHCTEEDTLDSVMRWKSLCFYYVIFARTMQNECIFNGLRHFGYGYTYSNSENTRRVLINFVVVVVKRI
jgi:hypothetical protein